MMNTHTLRRGAVAAVAIVLAAAAVISPSYADPGNGNSEICPPLSSGKIDTAGDPSTITVSDPLAVEVCVKAGTTIEFHAVDSVPFTIGHSSGKDVSHYSYRTEQPATEPCEAASPCDPEPCEAASPCDPDPTEPVNPCAPGVTATDLCEKDEPALIDPPVIKCRCSHPDPVSDIGEALEIEHSYDAETGTTTTKVNGEITEVVVHDQSIEEGL